MFSELPVLQAPMAGAQDSALAIAVARAGGLGALPCALLDVAAMRKHLGALREAGVSRCNVNFFCHRPPEPDPQRDEAWRAALAPYYRELGVEPSATLAPARRPFDAETAALLDEFRPSVVSFHFGLPPDDLLARVRWTGATILGCATTVDEARWLERKGVDAIVAQGLEAGGHRGVFLSEDLTTQVGTLALVPQIVRAVRVPVVAAGGIADRRGVEAAMALGAAAAQVGTAYLLCPEAATSAVHRAALARETAGHTAVTNVFTGRPARGIVNRLMRDLGYVSPLAPVFPLAAAAVAPLRARAESLGWSDFSPLWAGQSAGACRAVAAGALTRELGGAA